jgi:pyruvate,water dikinase
MSAHIARSGTAAEIGGKAASLASLAAARMPIPPWFALRPPLATPAGDELPPAIATELCEAVRTLLRSAPPGQRLAVRSSAIDEDGASHSFAGQFESHLDVAPDDVSARVRDVWRSASAPRVEAYRREHQLPALPRLPAVIVQWMVEADASGVAFSADPVSGQRGICVVDAVRGIGERLVSGEVDADSFRVTHAGDIVDRRLGSTRSTGAPAVSDEQVRAVATLARRCATHFGRPQDIEWAIADGRLFLLQSRAITSLAGLVDPDGTLTIWDNSNIVESYAGVTTPLTYSFARYVYEEVYRQFCRIVGVPERRIAANGDALRAMLGLVRGRIYYNLVSWYRLLALFPGYRLNRRFMEQMMGVREGIPQELERRLAPSDAGRLRDALDVAGTMRGLIVAHRRLPRSIDAFRARLDAALASESDLSSLRAEELVAHYRQLERTLLTQWDAPLVNDFFAMVFHGAARKLVAARGGADAESMLNELVSGGGDIVSAEPARRIESLARLAAEDRSLVDALADGDVETALAALAEHPELQRQVDDYLRVFGERCLEELKLETMTLNDDPMMLLRAIGRLARARHEGSSTEAAPAPSRTDERARVEPALLSAAAGSWPRTSILRWVVRNAAVRVRDRENLRFERTRVFGRVRRIFVQLGRRYAAQGALDDPRDVFYLTVEEALGWVSATTASADIRSIACARKAEFARYASLPAPADRFETRGAVHADNDVLAPERQHSAADDAGDEEARQGIGCFPGTVRGVVRVIRDPRDATLAPGEILVAERTDPGWIMLFPGALGLLVERGSLLSHSAIVARELRIPAVVSIPSLTRWLETGDLVEFDGRTGLVRRVGRARQGAP